MGHPAEDADRLRIAARRLLGLADAVESGSAARQEVDDVVAEIVGAQLDHFGPRPKARRGEGGKGKILAYLGRHVGQPVHGEELAAVSGIHEWARRVRELRVEDGYEIAELGASTYRLESMVPDAERAQQWQSANEIRNRPGSARSRIEAFLEANVRRVVTREQIDYVSGIAEGSRRVRELRDEVGWPINSHIDEPDLSPSEYRLMSTAPEDRREASQRLYPEDLRAQVFERDNYTCQACGRNREKALAAGDARFYLEVHHRVAMADELEAMPLTDRHDISNLVTLCHADHLLETAELHRRRREQRRDS